MDSKTRLFVAIAVAVSSVGAVSARAATPDSGHDGFQPGEGFVYTFSVGAIDAGRARIAVGLPVRSKGKRLVAVQAEARSAPWLALLAKLEDTYKVILDADSLRPSSVESIARGFREHQVRLQLDGQKVFIDFHNAKVTSKGMHTIVKAPVDLIAALFMVRAAPLVDGDSFEMYVFDGGALYKSNIKTAGREQVTYEGQKVRAIHVDIVATRVDDAGRPLGQPLRHGQIWLTDDERRVPFKALGDTDLGPCDVDLVAYQRSSAPRLHGNATALRSTGASPSDQFAPAVVQLRVPSMVTTPSPKPAVAAPAPNLFPPAFRTPPTPVLTNAAR